MLHRLTFLTICFSKESNIITNKQTTVVQSVVFAENLVSAI